MVFTAATVGQIQNDLHFFNDGIKQIDVISPVRAIDFFYESNFGQFLNYYNVDGSEIYLLQESLLKFSAGNRLLQFKT
jgi:hypothetical protein